MSWENELKELALRKELAARMGGEEKVRRHREGGKLPVRERIAKMVDSGSFREVGALAGSGTYDEQGRLKDLTPSNLLIVPASEYARLIPTNGNPMLSIIVSSSSFGTTSRMTFSTWAK